MNETIRKSLDRLKDTIESIESPNAADWNASLGTAHLSAWADQLVNDAKMVSSHMKSFGK